MADMKARSERTPMILYPHTSLTTDDAADFDVAVDPAALVIDCAVL